jgi:hypothetical protein
MTTKHHGRQYMTPRTAPIGISIPDLDDPRMLRHVSCDGYILLMWDLDGRTKSTGQYVLGYAFYAPGAAEPLFLGEDYGCSPMDAIDSNESVRCLLTFLTLRPGDTDREYFEDYTPEQMAFAEGDAERISMFALEPDDDDPDDQWPYWTNLDDRIED